MSQHHADILRRLLRANGLGEVLDAYSPSSDSLLGKLLEMLDKVTAEYRARIGISTSFTPESLEIESTRNPHKIRAFLQAMRRTESPEMLVMVWRILQGLNIQEVRMTCQQRKSFELVITLTQPGPGQASSETYNSTNIFDARLLQHFGMVATVDGPKFDGFFPLRLNE